MHRTRKTKSESVAVAVQRAPAKTTKPPAARRTAKPANPPTFDPEAHRQEIAETAYHLWLARGPGQGSAAEDWARAEIIVQLRYNTVQRAAG